MDMELIASTLGALVGVSILAVVGAHFFGTQSNEQRKRHERNARWTLPGRSVFGRGPLDPPPKKDEPSD